MERFVDKLDDPAAVDELRDALAGKGAFSRFRATLGCFPAAREQWFQFERRDYERLAREWLASIGESTVEPAAAAARVAEPTSPTIRSAPLRIVHVLLLGTPDGKTEIIGGRVRRSISARTDGEAQRAF